MLAGIRRLAMLVVPAATVVLLSVPSAMANEPTCETRAAWGRCVVWVGGPGSGSNPGGGGSGGGSGGGGGGSSAPVVTPIMIGGIECYPIGLTDPQPEFSDPIWGGRTDGAIYDCLAGSPSNPGLFGGMAVLRYWAATAPVMAAPPDPADLAQQAVESMNLSAITIGIVPEPGPDSVGLIGMPVWMWVEQPSESTWGPITRTASSGPWSVTATGEVADVTWEMGDGAVVHCEEGVPYQDAFGKQSSPSCGHTYSEQGEYTVRATSHWVIRWNGIGESGTIRLDLTQSAPVTMGEVQVLRQ